jgi:hypothetical protein
MDAEQRERDDVSADRSARERRERDCRESLGSFATQPADGCTDEERDRADAEEEHDGVDRKEEELDARAAVRADVADHEAGARDERRRLKDEGECDEADHPSGLRIPLAERHASMTTLRGPTAQRDAPSTDFMTSLGQRSRTFVASVFRWVGHRVLAILWKFAVRAPNIAKQGIPVRLWLVERQRRAEVSGTVRKALKLIEKFDAARYARMQRDLAGIVVSLIVPAGTAGVYADKHRVCGINPDSYPLNFVLVATVIVHEATHARLRRFRMVGRCAARIEGICRAQELAFLARVPHTEATQRVFREREERRAREFEESDSAKAERAIAALRREVPQEMADTTERVTRWLGNLRP